MVHGWLQFGLSKLNAAFVSRQQSELHVFCAVTTTFERKKDIWWKRHAVITVAGNSTSCKPWESGLVTDTDAGCDNPERRRAIASHRVKEHPLLCVCGEKPSRNRKKCRQQEGTCHCGAVCVAAIKAQGRLRCSGEIIQPTTTRKRSSGFQPTGLCDSLDLQNCLHDPITRFYYKSSRSKQRLPGSDLGCPYKECFVVMPHHKNEDSQRLESMLGLLWERQL